MQQTRHFAAHCTDTSTRRLQIRGTIYRERHPSRAWLTVEAPDDNNQSDDEAEKDQKAEPYQEEGEAGEER